MPRYILENIDIFFLPEILWIMIRCNFGNPDL